MKDFDFIFTQEQYDQLQQAYSRALSPNIELSQSILNGIIHMLQHTSFMLPLHLQNEIIRDISQAKQILDILQHSQSRKSNIIGSSSPFILIYTLAQLSKILNKQSLKSPYQILCIKSNELILSAV